MREKIGKILYNLGIILIILTTIMILNVILSNFKIVIEFTWLIEIVLLGFFLFIFSAYFQINENKSKKDKKKIIRKNIIALFILYILALIIALFLKSGMGLFYETDNYIEYLKNNYNLIPFKTIIYYFNGFIKGNIIFKNLIFNIFGNIVIFIFLGIFIYILFYNTREFKKYILILSLIIILVEIVQLITKTGFLDIDDYILNITGALIGYSILKNEKIDKKMKKMYII